MTVNKLNKILETYGCDSSRWPESEKQECLHLIATDSQAKAIFEQYVTLEKRLGQLNAPDFSGLEEKVLLQSLPARKPSLSDRVVRWLISSATTPKYGRPALLACLPLLMGIIVGNYYHFGISTSDDGFNYWEDELLMLSFNEYTETDLLP